MGSSDDLTFTDDASSLIITNPPDAAIPGGQVVEEDPTTTVTMSRSALERQEAFRAARGEPELVLPSEDDRQVKSNELQM